MHTLVLIFVGGFCIGLIAFAIQVIMSPVSSHASEQQIQKTIGISLLILSIIGFIISMIYFVLNWRFYAKKDWGGIVITENTLKWRYFNQWRWIEKEMEISTLFSVFVHTCKGQACIQLTANSPLQISEIPCKHLSNEDLTKILSFLKNNLK